MRNSFRWINSAVVLNFIVPFTSTLSGDSDGLVARVYAQFQADILTNAALQLSDYMGNLNRHFLAPTAKTQDAMNMAMSGTSFELAERYANVTKIFFLATYNSVVYPAGFFYAGAALTVTLLVDRFSLTRSWKRPPQLGTSMSKLS